MAEHRRLARLLQRRKPEKSAAKKTAREENPPEKSAAKQTPPETRGPAPMPAGQRAYEERRAARAGMTLEQWMRSKQRQQAQAAEQSKPPELPKKKGLMTRLLDRAHQPLKPPAGKPGRK